MTRTNSNLGLSTGRNKNSFTLFTHVRWQHLAAGVSGGVISTLILHPLDLIKVRFQVNEGATIATTRPQYKGVADAFLTISRNEGFKGLYRGVTPNVWGAGASWGLYFLFYNSIKAWIQDGDSRVTLSAGQSMLAAAESGVLTLILTNPIWVAKTRLCLQYDAKVTSNMTESLVYRGMRDCVVKIYSTEGFRGLYKGFVPGVFGTSHGALQFMAYEELKKMYNNYRAMPPNTAFNSFEYLSFAALSKIFAASITYPYQVVRARLQDQHRQYQGIIDVIKRTYRYEGARGFFKGLAPYLIHVTPNICIVLLVYEHVMRSSLFHKENPPVNNGQNNTKARTDLKSKVS